MLDGAPKVTMSPQPNQMKNMQLLIPRKPRRAHALVVQVNLTGSMRSGDHGLPSKLLHADRRPVRNAPFRAHLLWPADHLPGGIC